jgi:hypothetical protein
MKPLFVLNGKMSRQDWALLGILCLLTFILWALVFLLP